MCFILPIRPLLVTLTFLALPFVLMTGGPTDRADALVSGIDPCAVGPLPTGETLYEEGFEGGPAGWSLVSTFNRPNLWHWTTFTGNGTANDDMFHGGPGRLYYGIENTHGGTYNTSRMRNQGEYRSPAVPLAAGGTYAIALNTKWHVEFDRPWLIDSMMLGYALDGGARAPACYMGNVWATYWNIPMGYGYYQTSPWGNAMFTGCEYALESPQNPCRFSEDQLDTETAFDLAPDIALWEPRFIVLPANVAGHDLHVSVYFQTGDAIVDDAMGWMVDDVRVVRLA